MSNCAKCNQPLNVGNIKIGKNNRREHRKCPEVKECKYHSFIKCYPHIYKSYSDNNCEGCPNHSKTTEAKTASIMPSQSTEAKATKTIKAESRLIPAAQIGQPLPFRLFVNAQTVANFERVASRHMDLESLFHIKVIASDPDLPDREPEAFQGLTEIMIVGVR